MSYLFAKITPLFSRLKVLLPKSHRWGRFSFVFILIVGATVWFLSAQPTSAQLSIFSIAKNSILEAVSYLILLLAALFMKLTLFMLDFVIEMGGYNGFINSDAVKVGWVMVRDVANMFFVVILLVIAFATILGIESYEWKKLLPKFILAAILVNFSRVICGLIIDVSQVIMITFINGVAATAGTNLIQFFNLDEIQKLSAEKKDLKVTEGNVFMASVGGLTFAALAMAVMAIYVIILVARIVVLWVLIVLSPLAFVLSVIPHTQKYASQWWTQFGGQVIVGPLLAFFLWLSFVTLTANTEGINAHIAANTAVSRVIKPETKGNTAGGEFEQSGGITTAMSWHKMANFAIAIGMLVVGAKAAQQTGAVGGGMAAGAINFGKRVATIASGVAAGLWLAKGAGILGIKGAKGLGYHVLGGKRIHRYAVNEWDSIKGWFYGTAMESEKERKLAGEIAELEGKVGATGDTRVEMTAKKKEIDDKLVADDKLSGEDPKKLLDVDRKALETEQRALTVGLGSLQEGKQRDALLGQLETKKKEMAGTVSWWGKVKTKGLVGAAVGWQASRTLELEKRMAKTKRQMETREKIVWKQTGSESGGVLLGMTLKSQKDSQDRIERGYLKAEEMRSAAKDEEGENIGFYETLSRARYKKNIFTGKKEYELHNGTMQERVTQHRLRAEEFKAKMENLEATAKLNLILSPETPAKMSSIGKVPFKYEQVEEAKATAKIIKDRLGKEEERSMNEVISEKIQGALDMDQKAGELETGQHQTGVTKQIADEINRRIAGKDEEIATQTTKVKEAIEELQDIDKAQRDLMAREEKIKLEKGETSDEYLQAIADRSNFEDRAEKEKSELQAQLEADTKVLQQHRAAAEILKEKRKEAVGGHVAMADALRAGDFTVAQKMVRVAQEMSRETAAQAASLRQQAAEEGDVKKKADLESQAADLESQAAKKEKQAGEWSKLATDMQHGGTTLWGYASAQARAAETTEKYRYRHTRMLSDAKQRVVWDERGVLTPTSATDEIVAEAKKELAKMPYDQFVASAGQSFVNYFKKAKEGKVTDQDKAGLVALFERGFEESWIDDIIIGIMSHTEGRQIAMDKLGWTDMSYTKDRIGDLQTYIATGGNIKTTSDNVIIRELFDQGTKQNMNMADILQGARDGSLRGVAGFMDNTKKHLASLGRHLTKSQEDLLEAFFAEGEAAAKIRVEALDSYMASMEKNQSFLEYFGNLRNDAIKRGHYENGGWSIFHDVGGGKKMYLTSGVDMAKDFVYSDVNKTKTSERAAAHPHVVYDLGVDAVTGQIASSVRASDLSATRGDITDARSWGNTTRRYVAMTLGLASTENMAEFKDAASGGFVVGRSKKCREQGKKMRRWQWKKASQQYQSQISSGQLTQAQLDEVLSAQRVMEEIFLPYMQTNMSDFLMTVGAGTGISAYQALKGDMGLDIPYINEQGKYDVYHARKANQFVDFVNKRYGTHINYKPLSDAEMKDAERQEQI